MRCFGLNSLPEDEEVMTKQEEIIYATFAQIEAAIDHRNDMLYPTKYF